MSGRRLLPHLISPAQTKAGGQCLLASGLCLWLFWPGQNALAQYSQGENGSQLLPISSYLPVSNVEPPRFRRIEDVGATENGDYLTSIMANTKNKVFRFNEMPVRIYIQPAPRPEFERACERAWQNWQFRSGGLVSFTRVYKPEQARVKIIWTHLRDATLGAHTVTKWHQESNGSWVPTGGMYPLFVPGPSVNVPPQEINMNLAPIENEQDPELQPLLVENLVTHEIGHALGMIGHSPNHNDMMYQDTDVFSRISQRDLNTLKRLYRLTPDVPL
jgi:hypothetical protein